MSVWLMSPHAGEVSLVRVLHQILVDTRDALLEFAFHHNTSHRALPLPLVMYTEEGSDHSSLSLEKGVCEQDPSTSSIQSLPTARIPFVRAESQGFW
jgi:hypothetical protein